MNNENKHPDIIDLEFYRTGEAGTELREHIESCEQCQQALEELNALASSIELDVKSATVSDQTDQEVLSFISDRAAAIQLGEKSERLMLPTIFRVAMSIAAIVLLSCFAVWMVFFTLSSFQPKTEEDPPPQIAGDLNHDGEVNIIDAYLMAQKVGNDQDKRVTELAATAVALGDRR